MSLLELNVPQHSATPAGSGPQSGEVESWLAELPLGDPVEAARALVEGLASQNGAAWPAAARLATAERIRPVCEETGAALRTRLRNCSLPLSPRTRRVAELAMNLLRELADSYKIALLELAQVKAAGPTESALRLLALYRAVELLGRQVVDTYLIYDPEPCPLWGELHRIYRYAELMGIHQQPLSESGSASVEHAYKRVALLAVAGPYQLMQQEANTVYQWLDRWVERCAITGGDALGTVAGKFYVDLDSEDPPRYGPRKIVRHPANPRILDSDPLAAAISGRLAAIAKETKVANGTAAPLPLAQRMERDLLVRLRDAWHGPRDRTSMRRNVHADVEIAAGLSACHHFLSAGAAFAPEKDEIAVHRATLGISGGAGGTTSNLSLIPTELEPWKLEENELRLAHDIEAPRHSVFDANSKDLDMWQKIYFTGDHAKSELDSAEVAYRKTPWQQKNSSNSGLCLYCSSDCPVHLRVGELVVFQISGDTERWQVGTARWLCAAANQRLEMGIEVLADSATPLAIRGIQGVGKDSEYFRALRLPAGDITAPGGTLIVPAAIYDNNTITVLNLGQQLFYGKLTTLVETTRCYARFRYELVEAPGHELEKLESLKRLL